MTELTLAKSLKIIDSALAKGKELGLKPLAVVVLDAGGHLKAFQREDGASMMRFEIASGKAYGALALGVGSRWLNAQAETRPHFLEGLSAVSGGKIVAIPGGVLVKDSTGAIIGAVGITGDTSDNDEIAAIAGIEAAGFTPDAG
ncbi:GlcG/HbpS family heme-binding protein [Hoeflea alexandrii]|uniref:Heme-binding protein n=1 Tax=Hoeflea alexandrii TaxID=288436 RepID=A0ABT1CQU4_9HYPH|nr:heme-binding protein [Hoeflea alexandrii]MCO6408565.1 heme-binding protein [Hoeflea alexandrii]MCY0151258.1 heme-binding protein [Hoeflea alexandrii]